MKRFVELVLEKVAKNEISADTAYILVNEYKKDLLNRDRVDNQDEQAFKSKDIAVIGMSCRFSGADTPDEFWTNLVNGIDSVKEISEERWKKSSYYSEDRTKPLTSYSKWGSLIDTFAMFDPEFFDIKEEYAKLIDPQQRLFLMLCWEVMEHAGYGSKASRRDKSVGVFVGARGNSYNIYEGIENCTAGDPTQKEKIEAVRAGLLGKAPNMIAAGISNLMDLKGPSVVVDSACSSSLVGIHTACRSILAGECAMAIAGGVDLLLTPELYVYLSQIKAISPDGKCMTFDSGANGYVPGEGGGAVLLKPLDDAIRDGDRVYAVIKGSHVNNDGFTIGVTTPDVEGQKKVIKGALEACRISPETISLIEAHGTGTFIGDPIEIRALTEVFREYTNRENYCALGAVKTNIGHLHAAAGIASFIKVVLSLYNKKIPKTLHCNKPNPRFDLISSPFYISADTQEWEGIDGIRRAGISSFGFGGTNCHMILEQSKGEAVVPNNRSSQNGSFMLGISAKSQRALVKMAVLYAQSFDHASQEDLEDICFTINTGREVFPYRLAFSFNSSEDARQKLIEASKAIGDNRDTVEGICSNFAGGDKEIKTAFMFPGQGSQYIGMAKELYDAQMDFRQSFDNCSRLFEPYLGCRLIDCIYSGQYDQKRISETALTQPLVFAVGYSLAKMWMAWGVEPCSVMGHSIGEYTAACIAGVFSIEDAVKLVALRGKLMQEVRVTGGMRVIFSGYETVMEAVSKLRVQFPGQIAVAAINGPANTVVSGSLDALKAIEDIFISQGCTVRDLSVSHPFHSPMMEPMLEEYRKVLEGVRMNNPRIAVISNVTGDYIDYFDKEYWCQHILETVDFNSSINCLLKNDVDVLLEVGPGTTLLSMVKHIVKDREDVVLASTLNPSQKDWLTVYNTVSRLFTAGAVINLAPIFEQSGRKRRPLPLYPFELKRYMIDQNFRLSRSSSGLHNPEEITPIGRTGEGGLRLLSDEGERFLFERVVELEKDTWIDHHKVNGKATLPAVYYWELVRSAAREAFGEEVQGLGNIVHLSPVKMNHGTRVILNIEIDHTSSFAIRSRMEGNPDGWVLNAKGEIMTERTTQIEKADLKALKNKFQGKYISGSRLLEIFRERGLEYGPQFFALNGVWCKELQAFCEIKLPEEGGTESCRIIDYPALIDAALQSAVAIARLENTQKPYLPFSVKKVEYKGRLSPVCYGYAKLVKRSTDGMSVEIDVKIMDERGQVKLEVKGLGLRAVGSSFSPRNMEQGSNIENWFYVPYWKCIADSRISSRTSIKRLVVFQSESRMGARITAALENRGHEIVRVKTGWNFKAEKKGEYTINPYDIKQYDELFEHMAKAYPKLDGILHLLNLGEGKDGMADLESLAQSQYTGAFGLVHIVKGFTKYYGSEGFLLAVSCDTLPVTGDEKKLSPEKATMLGVIKTVPLEYGKMRCAFLDMDALVLDSQGAGEIIANEIEKGIQNEICAIRKRKKYVMGIKQIRAAVNSSKSIRIKSRGVYLIAGGMGGLGLEIAKYIASKAMARLVLINRTALPPKSNWDSWLLQKGLHDSTSKKILAIREIEQKGSEVLIFSGDICDYNFMEDVTAKIREKFGKIDGVINSTIVLNDVLIRNMTMEDMEKVIRPKLLGSWVLDRVTSCDRLDFFIMFSGMVTYFANAGQSNYACGSFFQDIFAHYREIYGRSNTIVVNWGIWGETGIVSQPFYIEKLLSKGIRPMKTKEGIEAFERILGLGCIQVGVAPLDEKLKEALVDEEEEKGSCKNSESVKSEEKQNTNPVSAAGGEQTLQIKPGESRNAEMKLEAKIKKLLSEMTACLVNKDENAISKKRNFLELGLDSIGMVSMTDSIEKELGIKLYPTLFFEYSNINDLAGYFLKNHRDSLISLIDCENTDRLAKAEPEVLESADAFETVSSTDKKMENQAEEICFEDPSEVFTETYSETGLEYDAFDSSIEELFTKVESTVSETAQTVTLCTGEFLSVQECSDIAIIGMAGIFPGAGDVEEFWSNIINGVESVREVSSDRWNPTVYYSQKRQPGKTYCKRGGFVEGIDQFDSLFFNISPKEASSMDPQQRLALKTAWHALEDAGYGGAKLYNSKTGVYMGVSSNNYFPIAFDPDNNYSGLGTSSSIIPNRISFFMNFRGPSVCIETQCSSSLVAIHHACQAIRSGDCDQAMAGGVNLIISPEYYILLSQMEALSPDGKCYAFDKRANGFVDGEGIGIVVLKKLEDAIRDGDNIHAVIKGTHVNHDGHSGSLTAPNSIAQSELIREAICKSGIDARTISYIEAHGTGTSLGDPIEIKGITKAFEAFTGDKAFCAIGSVKSNVGHLEAAAGIAGLIKVVMAMKYKILPKSLNFERPNPYIDFNASPVYVLDRNTRWETKDYPLRAGVSCFGMGGTNAHVILEEPGQVDSPPVNHEVNMQLATFSARSNQSLRALLEKFDKHFEKHDDLDIGSVCYTLNTGRGHFNHRVSMVVKDLDHLRKSIKTLLESDYENLKLNYEGIYYGKSSFAGHENSSVYGNASVESVIPEPDERMALPMIRKGKNEIQEDLAQLYVEGCDIDWENYYSGSQNKKVSLPTYVFDDRRCWVQGSTPLAKYAGFMDSHTAPGMDTKGGYLYQWDWMKVEESNTGKIKSGVWVIFADRLGISPAISRQMVEMGQKIVRVVRGDFFKRIDAKNFIIDPRDYESYKALFEYVRKDFGKFDGIVHLWSCESYTYKLSNEEMLEDGFYNGIYSIFFISKAISQMGIRNKFKFLAAVSYSSVMMESNKSFAAERYPVQVALRGAAAEIPNAKCTYMDFDIEVDSCEDIAKKIQREICSVHNLREVVYRGASKWTRRLQTIKVLPAEYKWDKDGVYLITGGASGVGSLIAMKLTEKASPGIILTGQKILPQAEEWDSILNSGIESAAAKRIKLIKNLESMGSKVLYYAVDICDLERMKEILTDAQEKLGAVTGVFHCAGIKEDAIIENKNFASFKRVIAPKVKGALVLKELFKNCPPRFVILFSSISSLYGSAGQYDYSIGNAFMDGLSYTGAFGPLCRCVSINWPLWEQGSMELGSVNARKMEEDGMLHINGAEGFEIIETVLAHSHINNASVLKLADRENFLGRLEDRMLFNDMGNDWLLEESATMNALKIEEPEDIEEPALQGNGTVKGTEDIKRTIEFLKKTVSELLIVSPDELDDDTEFGYYGMDSLAIKDAMYRVESYYQESMEPSMFEEYPTINKLAAYLNQRFGTVASAGPEKTVRSKIADSNKVARVSDIKAQHPEETDLKTLALRKVLMSLYNGSVTQGKAKEDIQKVLKDHARS